MNIDKDLRKVLIDLANDPPLDCSNIKTIIQNIIKDASSESYEEIEEQTKEDLFDNWVKTQQNKEPCFMLHDTPWTVFQKCARIGFFECYNIFIEGRE